MVIIRRQSLARLVERSKKKTTATTTAIPAYVHIIIHIHYAVNQISNHSRTMDTSIPILKQLPTIFQIIVRMNNKFHIHENDVYMYGVWVRVWVWVCRSASIANAHMKYAIVYGHFAIVASIVPFVVAATAAAVVHKYLMFEWFMCLQPENEFINVFAKIFMTQKLSHAHKLN